MYYREHSGLISYHPVLRRHPVFKIRGEQSKNITLWFNHRKERLIVQAGKTQKFPKLMTFIVNLSFQFKNSSYLLHMKHMENLGTKGKSKNQKPVNAIQFVRLERQSSSIDPFIGFRGYFSLDSTDNFFCFFLIFLHMTVFAEKLQISHRLYSQTNIRMSQPGSPGIVNTGHHRFKIILTSKNYHKNLLFVIVSRL